MKATNEKVFISPARYVQGEGVTARAGHYVAALGKKALLIASDVQQPATLFSYVLLLDAGLLWLARARRWPALALLSLASTALHQGLWILSGMDEDVADNVEHTKRAIGSRKMA